MTDRSVSDKPSLPTPRSDAVWNNMGSHTYRLYDEARQIERELAELKAQLNAGMLLSAQSASAPNRDADRYQFLRVNYPRMIISVCCGTYQGQTIEEAESRLDKSIASDSAARTERGEKA